MTNLEEAESSVVEDDTKDRSACGLCGRKFLTERLGKHLEICQKIKEKKRKTFDAAKQRAENLDKINLVPTEISIASSKVEDSKRLGQKKANASSKNKGPTKGQQNGSAVEVEQTKSKPKPTWKARHEEFLKTIRAARGEDMSKYETEEDNEQEEQGDRSKTLPPGMVQCPTCGRNFSDRAADRHIVWCGQKQQKEHMKQRHSNGSNNLNQEALERMKARTKYKPPTLTTSTASGGSSSSGKRSRSESKRSSLGTGGEARTRASSNSSRQSSEASSSTSTSTTSNINRKYTRNISKSTESLTHKSKTTSSSSSRAKATSVGSNKQRSTMNTPNGTAGSRASMRTEHNNYSGDHARQLQREVSNRTIVIRKTAPSGSSGKCVTAKVNTGLCSPKKGTPASPTKMAAPVMKFKEKFPHHQPQRTNNTQFDFEILRRNSSAYDDSPKTVPGVRTGGISPVKSNTTDKGNSMSKSEVNLHKIGGDIKNRIDMYISGIYESDLLNHYASNINRFVDDHFHKGGNKHDLTEEEIEALKRESTAAVAASAEPQMRRPHSINSDLSGARGSTSDSTDSGLGVYINVNAQESIGKNGSLSNGGSTYPTEIVSPPMSELERRSRMLLRNGSLNDIHLMGQGMILADVEKHREEDHAMLDRRGDEAAAYFEEVDLPLAEMTPRFCHSCGTKYPNTLAKFCYECGNRRFVDIS